MARGSESEGGSVVLATLRRGKIYKHFYDGRYWEFKQRVPIVVPDELADELEQLIDIVNTDDRQQIEMDRFDIDRDAVAPEEEEAQQTRTRLRLKQETVPVRAKPKPKIKAPPSGFKRRASRTASA